VGEFDHPVFHSYLDYYNAVGQWTDPSNPNFGKVTPTKPYINMMAFADGVAWNPGSGAGYYRYSAVGVWTRVG